jgi:ATP-binding cassette, subfamily B, bacterial MsbA
VSTPPSGDATATGPITNPGRIYRRLLGYARPHLGMFGIGVIGMTIFAATDAAMAWFVRYFLNGTFVARDPSALWIVPGGIVAIFFLRGVGDYMSNYFPGYVGRQIIKSLRAELFGHYLRLPAAYYDKSSSAAMLSRLTYNIEQVAEATTNSITVLIRDTLTILALLVSLFVMNWQLATFVIALAPLISWLIQKINSSFRRYSTRIQNSMGDVTRVAKEALDGHRLIKVFNGQAQELRAFESVNELNRHSNMRLIAAKATSNPVVQLVAAIGLGGVLWVALKQVDSKEMQIGDFLAFITALLLITAPLRRLVGVFVPLQQGIAAGASVFDVLDQPVEMLDGGLKIERAKGDLEFRDVTFEYAADKGTVLAGVSLRIEAGKTAAIVGKSGSGKSTLVGLVPRFYDATRGEVLLDGTDVRRYALADLRNQVSLVSQDVMLFNDSIRNNIAFGTETLVPGAIERAAEAAYVMEFARDLPQGLDTVVGDRGSLLSGGQRQRVAIARALLKDAPLLILDEATSALDNESARRIQEALVELKRNRTTLVIAHRLATIEQADLIVVMDDGKIIEQGTYAALVARDGAYAALSRLEEGGAGA